MEEDSHIVSLLEEAKDKCVILDKKRVPDGEGGFITEWTEGAEFKAAIVFNTSMEARLAEKQGVTSLYTVTIGRNTMLEYHDVFRRLKDGKIFRITSDGDDSYTPASTDLDMRQVTAEEYALPKG